MTDEFKKRVDALSRVYLEDYRELAREEYYRYCRLKEELKESRKKVKFYEGRVRDYEEYFQKQLENEDK
jgi:hypothetical protein